MKISTANNSVKADALTVGVFEDSMPKETKELDKKLDGILSQVMKEESFDGSFKQVKIIRTNLPTKKVVMIGLGKKKEFDLDKLRRIASVSARKARKDDCKTIATLLHYTPLKNSSLKDASQAVTEGASLGLYKFDKHKTVDTDKIKKVDSFMLISDKDAKSIEAGMKNGAIISEATNYTRDLVNTDAATVTPSYLANEAMKMGKKYKDLKVKVYGESDMKKMGMNCILGVSAGSDQEAKFIVMEKKGKSKPIAIVGKGITFDSGGIDIKPAAYMYDMKLDMSGAGAVLGTVKAVCDLNLPVNLIAVIPTSENMTGGRAQKPGDILKAYNGKTIEMLHSDAEGRLILADALSYVTKNYKDVPIIDLATLTGAVLMALGYQAAALFGNDDKLKERIKKASCASGDLVWEMPLFEQYKEWVKAHNADVRNISKAPKGYEAGSATAAAFLENFVDGKWAHLDIAGTAFLAEDYDYLCKEGTGFGVRLLTQMLQDWK